MWVVNAPLTFNAREFSEIINDNFTGVNVIIDEWCAFLGPTSTKYRNASKTQPGGSQYFLSAIRAKLSLFLFDLSIGYWTCETNAKIPVASKQIRRQLQLVFLASAYHWCQEIDV